MVLHGIPEWNTLLQHDVTCTDFLSLEIVFGSVKTAELYSEFLENAPFLYSQSPTVWNRITNSRLCKLVNIFPSCTQRNAFHTAYYLKHKINNTLLKPTDIYSLQCFINATFIHPICKIKVIAYYTVILCCLSYFLKVYSCCENE